MASTKTEVAHDFHPWFRVYKDGHVERFLGHPFVPPSEDSQTAAVRSKDVTVSTTASARLFLPKAAAPREKLPIVIYIHGGAFSMESAFSSLYHNYLNSLVDECRVIAASVEYRLAPEHPLPACYDDCYAVMKWVAQHDGGRPPGSETGPDPWLNDHADLGKVYLAGDSAGANLAHNMVVRANGDGLMKISGLVLIHPFFGNEQPTKLWEFICSDSGGVNDPRLNPGAHPGLLSKLGCEKVLILTASKDFIRERGRSYCEALKASGWRGAVETVETEGEEHVFHLFKPTSEKAKAMMRCLVSFINPTNAPSA
ncbi:hypothetical protein RJ639_042103 [Escallonia herrerae]|uniref:Alpha/beta hydrolase fold-3 domain-containing protein n=1 Tax=Escallonia herrerae TaxID=1293975 RepID=A0AA89B2U3_9ASTE|nr:hypothetical protein RJ639_042103 [Escallonia herrerae]